MTRIPKVYGLVVCERIEAVRDKVSLVGVVSLSFPAFPTKPLRFLVYFTLREGLGEGHLKLVVQDLQTEKDLYAWERWLTLAPYQLASFSVPVRLMFLDRGRYQITLSVDGEYLTHRLFDVYSQQRR